MKRGTADATYLYYTLGKLEILKLREDYRKLKGDKFSLQEFHDAFLAQGFRRSSSSAAPSWDTTGRCSERYLIRSCA